MISTWWSFGIGTATSDWSFSTSGPPNSKTLIALINFCPVAMVIWILRKKKTTYCHIVSRLSLCFPPWRGKIKQFFKQQFKSWAYHWSHFMFKDLSSYKSFSYKAKCFILFPVGIQCFQQGNQTYKQKHLDRRCMIQLS